MKAKFSLLGTIILLIVVVVGCGGGEQLTVRQVEETRVARATETYTARETEVADRKGLLGRIAPQGTVIDEEDPEAGHDSSLTYAFEEMPPNGGAHNPTWQKCQVYDEPVKPEHAIHSMEHGGVWVTYQPDLDDDAIDDIEKLGRRQPFVLISPYPNLRSALVLSAWGIQLELDDPDDPRAEQFINAYANGPQTPEPGANCTTGTTALAAISE